MYKLIKFDLTCTYNLVGTPYYPLYKIIRTLLILFMVISYIGSVFYGLAYYLLISDSQHQNLIWIVYTPAYPDLDKASFIIQL